MRITTSVILFYLWFSAAGALMEAVGVAENMGLSTNWSVGDGLERSVDGLSAISGGGISVEALVGIYTLITGAVQTFIGGLSAGPRLMLAAGVPMEIVVFLNAPVALLGGRMIIYAFSGRDL